MTIEQAFAIGFIILGVTTLGVGIEFYIHQRKKRYKRKKPWIYDKMKVGK